ncbi:flagellar hook-associated protein FlgK [Actibacterium lipolyticum]|uniref:Flagellar hook-associated protein 1 n=1 Tax=Actibacterium lipolyticum TaxID=1524263 RepID=A0A238KWZ6_9RHOB|nr:flagellar hook-associated protein FlgK [Actibacterium lipolyticum]SMX47247.1 Flagellar hook-associated protein 1 [Actibacterium lipolyticum]
MSISSSLSNALSGLTAAARAAEVVSANVANATTEGYGRRVLESSAAALGDQGAGVRVDGVRREIDTKVLADRRLADASAANAEQYVDFFSSLEVAIGTPDSANSLSGSIAALDSALIEAASRPDSDARLANVLTAANGVVDQFANISDEIQTLRAEAEQGINAQVRTLNTRLEQIADLNHQIRLQDGSGNDTAALMDQRQVLVDDLAEIVPVRVVQRDHGEIAIYTETGATLLEGKPAEFGFTPASTIVPEMKIESGALSGLTLNGQPISVAGPYSPIAGGSLQALFDQRDVLAVDAQADLDALARDLIERFEGVDPTTASGAPGLFTDAGGSFDPAQEVGLSSRLSINALVDPDQGGAVWHLRAGLGATDPGAVGDSTLLNAFSDALNENRIASSGTYTGAARSAAGLSAEFLSTVSTERLNAEANQSFAQAKAETLREAERAGGVDTDHEMQSLLLIEQSYSANARVIQTIDEMIDTLLRI